jgi:hypothetical protein
MPRTGTIGLPDGKIAITCIIKEMSDTGAHLKVSSPQGVPQHFTFTASNDLPREASVLWWDIDAVGIHFHER